jgi:D-alanyl-D-alanine carboxypeptidase
MRELIQDKIAQASTKRTAPMVAEAPVAAETKPEPKVAAKPESKPEPKVAAKVEPKAESKAEAKPGGKPEPRFAIASATSIPVRFGPPAARTAPALARTELPATAAPGQHAAAGSTDPIRPVLVKTLTVRAGTQTASLAPMPIPSAPPAEAQPVRAAAAVATTAPAVAVKLEAPTAQPVSMPSAVKAEPPAPAPTVAAKPEAPAAQPALAVAATPEPPTPEGAPGAAAAKPEPAASAPFAAAKPEPGALAFAPVAAAKAGQTTPLPTARPSSSVAFPAIASAAAKPQPRSGWMIQVGAYPGEQAAKERLSTVQSKASKMLTGAEAFTETIEKGGTTYYRARFAGLDKDKAEAACKYLKKNDVECVTIKN